MKKMFFVAAGIILGFCFLADNGNAAMIQWSSALGGNDHWYERVDDSDGISWSEAKAVAESKGGYLATITSLEEDVFVIDNLIIPVQGIYPERPRNGDWFPYWLGGYQEEQTPGTATTDVGWKWITGETWDYTNWYGAEPNDAGGPYGDGLEDIPAEAENVLTYWTETNMISGNHGNYGWNDLKDNTNEDRLGYFVEYDTNVVPEPATILLFGTGLVGFAFRKRKA